MAYNLKAASLSETPTGIGRNGKMRLDLRFSRSIVSRRSCSAAKVLAYPASANTRSLALPQSDVESLAAFLSGPYFELYFGAFAQVLEVDLR
jgi:hypothetical protein